MIGNILFWFAVVFVAIYSILIYTMIGFLLSEYVIDELLVFILTDYNSIKMTDLYNNKIKVRLLDIFQIILILFLPLDILCIIIFNIIKIILKKKRG